MIRVQPGFFAGGGERAGMRDDVRNAQLIGPLELDDERVERLLPQHLVRAGQIDQVRVMRDRMLDLAISKRRLEARRLILRDRLGPPLVVVLGEELHAVAAATMRSLDRLVIPASNRHVSAKNSHAASLKCFTALSALAAYRRSQIAGSHARTVRRGRSGCGGACVGRGVGFSSNTENKARVDGLISVADSTGRCVCLFAAAGRGRPQQERESPHVITT